MTRDAKRPRTERPPEGPGTLDDALDDLLGPSGTAGISLAAPDVPREAVRAALQPSYRQPEPVSDDVQTIADESPLEQERSSSDDTHSDEEGEEPTSRVAKQDPVPAAHAAPEPVKTREPAPKKRAPDLDGFESAGADPDRPRGGSGMLGFVLAFVIVVLAFAALIAFLRPDLLNEALGRPAPPPSGPTQAEVDAEQARLIAEHRALYGQLSVTSEPDGAQVLLYIGRGPAVATDLPTGVAYELVAFADGHSASRAIVPADATWETTPEGPRYELALQTSDVEVELARLDLGATRLPRDALGAPNGDLGSVRVVTSPPGARVYMLIGFTPGVHVENIRTDQPVELLVYQEGYEIERTLVGPSDWHEGPDGTKAADVSVTLHELMPVPRHR